MPQILEIMDPSYDPGIRGGDCFTDYTSLFRRLAELTACEDDEDDEDDEGFGQTELYVVRWASWEERERLQHDPDFVGEDRVVLEIDRLTLP